MGPGPGRWQLWIEEPTDSADFNDEGTAYEEPMDELPAHVGDDYTLAGDDSVIAPTPQEHAQHSPAAPATGSFPIQEQAGTERTVDTAVSHNAPAHSALEHDTVTAENSNGTEQGKSRSHAPPLLTRLMMTSGWRRPPRTPPVRLMPHTTKLSVPACSQTARQTPPSRSLADTRR